MPFLFRINFNSTIYLTFHYQRIVPLLVLDNTMIFLRVSPSYLVQWPIMTGWYLGFKSVSPIFPVLSTVGGLISRFPTSFFFRFHLSFLIKFFGAGGFGSHFCLYFFFISFLFFLKNWISGSRCTLRDDIQRGGRDLLEFGRRRWWRHRVIGGERSPSRRLPQLNSALNFAASSETMASTVPWRVFLFIFIQKERKNKKKKNGYFFFWGGGTWLISTELLSVFAAVSEVPRWIELPRSATFREHHNGNGRSTASPNQMARRVTFSSVAIRKKRPAVRRKYI